MKINQLYLLTLELLTFFSTSKAQTPSLPPGCPDDLHPLYSNVCDLSVVWGIVLEAVAALGVATSFVIILVFVSSIPFIQDKKKKSTLGVQMFFILGNVGLFCLVFAFIVKKSFASCASRRFLFGVFFAVCFSSLLAHAVRLNFLIRHNDGPKGWMTFFMALSLTTVEVIINTEWLVITSNGKNATDLNDDVMCNITNADFVLALIFVMLLICVTFVLSLNAQFGKYKQWKKHGIYILISILLSVVIWVAWITLYVDANSIMGRGSWDDPTLGIALVSNAWVFIFSYIIPEICQLTKSVDYETYDDVCSSRGVGYDTILKEHSSHNMYLENKAFSMDEPGSGGKPVSPYRDYNGQQCRVNRFQPTALALMNRNSQSNGNTDIIFPRVNISSISINSATSTIRAEDAFPGYNRNAAPTEGSISQDSDIYVQPQW
ncbi:G-protein coupled receptor family C group 5 member C-like [Protopterus annectens]|uniref:G-protein coupled receptor family C group 5 member C-like n=1 Tax=Protopterus annectens TaxID=7888 RepID=UPI001CFA5B17|nr:G-protein coupled receptor family C group 5 member C-like [Protopterus annectens]XP_043940975.1 G-protein coupled receptor family C group 5 member C-like [Protopterus annectens]